MLKKFVKKNTRPISIICLLQVYNRPKFWITTKINFILLDIDLKTYLKRNIHYYSYNYCFRTGLRSRKRLLLLPSSVNLRCSNLSTTHSSFWSSGSIGDGTCRRHSNAQVIGVLAFGCQSTIDNDVHFSLKYVLVILP